MSPLGDTDVLPGSAAIHQRDNCFTTRVPTGERGDRAMGISGWFKRFRSNAEALERESASAQDENDGGTG
jgi:hypothetical protein